MRWGSNGNRYTRGWKARQGIYVHYLYTDEQGRRHYYVGQTVDYDARYTRAEKATWELEDFFDVADRRNLGRLETIVMRWVERKGGVLDNTYQRRARRRMVPVKYI